MTDAISNQPRIPTGNTNLRSAGELSSSILGSSVSGGSTKSFAPTTHVTPMGSDTVSLSNVSQQIAQQSGFDQNKVNSIKQSIQNGNYAIDPSRIAQGFMSLEKLIKG